MSEKISIDVVSIEAMEVKMAQLRNQLSGIAELGNGIGRSAGDSANSVSEIITELRTCRANLFTIIGATERYFAQIRENYTTAENTTASGISGTK